MIALLHLRFKLCLFCTLAMLMISGVSNSPVPKTTYDQSQQGELNVRADLDNILILFIPSGGIRLVDNPQIGSILQIFSNARKNLPMSTSASPMMTSEVSDSPYKVDIVQSAIDKLQSDVESFNTVIPITKNFNIEKKDITSDSEEEKVDSNKQGAIVLHLADKRIDDDTQINNSQTSEEILVNFNENITSEHKLTNESDHVTADSVTSQEVKTSQTPVQEMTTIESIVTSQAVIPQKVIKGEKKEEKDTTNKPPTSTKTQDRVLVQTVQRNKPQQTQTNRQATRPSFVIPTPIKSTSQSQESDQHLSEESLKQLRLLQTGLTHCLPNEQLTKGGRCVPFETPERKSREDQEDLLDLLRFGVQPASESGDW